MCSECGLTLNWAEVFNPPRDPWFVESNGGRGLVRRAWVTWAWALLPRYFWGRVGMRQAPSPRRMLAGLLIVLLSLHAADGVVANLSRFVEIVAAGSSRRGTAGVPLLGGIPMVGQLFRDPGADRLAIWAAYASDDWTSPLLIVRYDISQGLAYDSWEWDRLSPGIAAALGATAAAPVMLMLLPQTRRLARVRPGHVLRAGVYSLAWTAGAWVLSILDAAANLAGALTNLVADSWVWTLTTGDIESGLEGVPVVWMAMLGLWWCAWWWSAIRHGLRLPEPRAAWLAVVTPSLLVSAIVLAYADWL